MYNADGSGGIPNMENAGSEKQKRITKIVLFISGLIFISMIVGSVLLGN
mgnify:FL=1|jgi:hypothetical protein|tara:strand:- start:1266 stop:1412 length:147 start_codon:yes stop_codon:yes gene_type:complete